MLPLGFHRPVKSSFRRRLLGRFCFCEKLRVHDVSFILLAGNRCSKVFCGRSNRDLVNRTLRIRPEFSYDSRVVLRMNLFGAGGCAEQAGHIHEALLHRLDRKCRVLSAGVTLALVGRLQICERVLIVLSGLGALYVWPTAAKWTPRAKAGALFLAAAAGAVV